MNAPDPVVSLEERILAAIAKASSKQPASADDVLAIVGGDASAYWTALEQLIQTRQIATAHVQRPATDAAPWLAIWPTGVVINVGRVTAAVLSRLFVPQRRSAVRDAHAPRSAAIAPPKTVAVKEPVMTTTAAPKKTRESASLNRASIAEMVRGRTAANGLLVSTIAGRLSLTTQGTDYLIKAMIASGQVDRIRLPGQTADRIYDPTAIDAAAPEAVTPEQPAYRHDDIQVHELVAGDVQTVPPSPDVRFALWDDGSLSVCDGDEITLLPADAVKRLALLLGVPRETAVLPPPAILSGPATAAASHAH
ncbi:hypothetical protein dqs_0591 [Azoarcus olearius]|uniref:hypothetical protein n=1 Tax=Azoarcus sp. (strain BH72) TaxID=418699 RepID=UPI0008062892|nr:hypothetical protein [Azoarcus olearius]ANQ83667.1 hypothetical protein dqs_0591 [Azoarcus olearius]